MGKKGNLIWGIIMVFLVLSLPTMQHGGGITGFIGEIIGASIIVTLIYYGIKRHNKKKEEKKIEPDILDELFAAKN